MKFVEKLGTAMSQTKSVNETHTVNWRRQLIGLVMQNFVGFTARSGRKSWKTREPSPLDVKRERSTERKQMLWASVWKYNLKYSMTPDAEQGLYQTFYILCCCSWKERNTHAAPSRIDEYLKNFRSSNAYLMDNHSSKIAKIKTSVPAK